MSKFLILLFWGTIFFTKSALAKTGDTLVIKATVTETYSIDYYVVVKAKNENGQKYTILSSLEAKTQLTNENCNNYKVKVGEGYTFVITKTPIMKSASGNNMFLPLGGFDYNGRQLLEKGELPYKALNMYKFMIFY